MRADREKPTVDIDADRRSIPTATVPTDTLPPTRLHDLLAAAGVEIHVLTADEGLAAAVRGARPQLDPSCFAQDWAALVGAVSAGKAGVLLLDKDALPVDFDDALTEIEGQAPGVVVVVAAVRREEAEWLMPLVAEGRVYRLLMKPAARGITRLLLESAVGRFVQIRDGGGEAPASTAIRRMRRPPRRPAFASRSAWLLGGFVAVLALGFIAGALSGGDWLDGEASGTADAREIPGASIEASSTDEAGDRPTIVEAAERASGTAASESASVATPDESASVALAGESASVVAVSGSAVGAPEAERASPGLANESASVAAASETSESIAVAPASESTAVAAANEVPTDGGTDAAATLVAAGAATTESAGQGAAEQQAGGRSAENDTVDSRAEDRMADLPAADDTDELRGASDAELERLLDFVDERVADGRLVEPEGDNARVYFEQAAALDAAAPRVLEARTRLASALIAAARVRIEVGDLSEAASLAESAFRVGAESELLAELDLEIEAANRRRVLERNEAQLAAASSRIREGRLISERGDDAIGYLTALRREAPNLPGVDDAWRAFVEAAEAQILDAIAGEEWERADTLIDALARDDADPDLAERFKRQRLQAEFLATPVSPRTLRLIESPPLAYPHRALRDAVEGWVDVEYVVDRTGSVRDIVVVDGRPQGFFDAFVIEAVSQQRYEPFIVEGQAYDRRVRTRLRFELE